MSTAELLQQSYEQETQLLSLVKDMTQQRKALAKKEADKLDSQRRSVFGVLKLANSAVRPAHTHSHSHSHYQSHSHAPNHTHKHTHTHTHTHTHKHEPEPAGQSSGTHALFPTQRPSRCETEMHSVLELYELLGSVSKERSERWRKLQKAVGFRLQVSPKADAPPVLSPQSSPRARRRSPALSSGSGSSGHGDSSSSSSSSGGVGRTHSEKVQRPQQPQQRFASEKKRQDTPSIHISSPVSVRSSASGVEG